MLKNLFKYDFKWINKVMLVYYIILFITTVLVTIIENMEQTFFLVIVDKILSGYLIGGSIAAFITCLMRIWVRYNSSFYKDESYLTHTLPATKNELFNSKILASTLSLIITLFFIACCFLFSYLLIAKGALLDFYNGAVAAIGKGNTILFIVGGVILILLEALFMMMSGLFGLTIGNRSNNNKILKSIIYAFASYVLFNIFTFIIIKLLDIFTSFDLSSKVMPSIGIIKMIGITAIILYFIYILIYYIVSKKLLNKGVNVD